MSYFKFENYEVKLNDERVLATPCINALFSLKYNKQEGDADGRKRIRGEKELAFLYFMTEYPPLFKLPPEDRKEEALRNAGLPEDYKLSKLLKEALEHVQNETKSVIKDVLNNSANMLHNFNKMIELINKQLADKMTEMMEEGEIDEGDVDMILKTMDKASGLTTKISVLGEQFKQAEKKFNDELDTMIGDLEISEWES